MRGLIFAMVMGPLLAMSISLQDLDDRQTWRGPLPASDHTSNFHFKSLGESAGNVGYGHIVMLMNMYEVDDVIAQTCATIRLLGKNNATQTNKFLRLTYSRIVESLFGRCTMTQENFLEQESVWVNTFSGTSVYESNYLLKTGAFRPKRQVVVGLIAVSSFLFGAYDLWELGTGGANANTVQTLQDHETRLIDARSIAILNKTTEYLGRIIENELEDMYKFEQLVHLNTASASVFDEVERILFGFHDLSRHRLNPALISAHHLTVALEALKNKMELDGYTFDLKGTDDLFSLETSHLIMTNGTLQIFVHIPAYKRGTTLRLYEYLPVPIAISEDQQTLYVMPEPEKLILGVSPDEDVFQELDPDFVATCPRRLGKIFCPDNNILDRRTTSSCLLSLFQNDVKAIRRHCKWTANPATDHCAATLRQRFPRLSQR